MKSIMGFMQSYKRLDNLCRDMNGVGVTGYLQDMEQTYAGIAVPGWKADYLKLKHYRYIRNQIAHENNATEESLCSLEDAAWIEEFYQRILHQTDPLAVYYKKNPSISVSRPSVTAGTSQNKQQASLSAKRRRAVLSEGKQGCAGWLLLMVAALSALSFLIFF